MYQSAPELWLPVFLPGHRVRQWHTGSLDLVGLAGLVVPLSGVGQGRAPQVWWKILETRFTALWFSIRPDPVLLSPHEGICYRFCSIAQGCHR